MFNKLGKNVYTNKATKLTNYTVEVDPEYDEKMVWKRFSEDLNFEPIFHTDRIAVDDFGPFSKLYFLSGPEEKGLNNLWYLAVMEFDEKLMEDIDDDDESESDKPVLLTKLDSTADGIVENETGVIYLPTSRMLMVLKSHPEDYHIHQINTTIFIFDKHLNREQFKKFLEEKGLSVEKDEFVTPYIQPSHHDTYSYVIYDNINAKFAYKAWEYGIVNNNEIKRTKPVLTEEKKSSCFEIIDESTYPKMITERDSTAEIIIRSKSDDDSEEMSYPVTINTRQFRFDIKITGDKFWEFLKERGFRLEEDETGYPYAAPVMPGLEVAKVWEYGWVEKKNFHKKERPVLIEKQYSFKKVLVNKETGIPANNGPMRFGAVVLNPGAFVEVEIPITTYIFDRPLSKASFINFMKEEFGIQCEPKDNGAPYIDICCKEQKLFGECWEYGWVNLNGKCDDEKVEHQETAFPKRSKINDGWAKGYHGYEFEFVEEISRFEFLEFCRNNNMSLTDVNNPQWEGDHALIYPTDKQELCYSESARSNKWTWRWVRTD